MKFIFVVLIIHCSFLFHSVFAIPRDTLKGREAMPVYSFIYQKNTKPFPCYIEYHSFIKEYFNKGVEAYIRTCSDYKFHNKNIVHVYTSHIDSFYIGHDFYKRILYNDTSKGILVKQIPNQLLTCFEYHLDDFEDLRINDSLKTIAFGLGAKNNEQSYFIFYFEPNYYIYNLSDNNKIDLPVSKNFIQLFSSDELLTLLKNKLPQYKDSIDQLNSFTKMNDLVLFLHKLTYENKK